MIHLTQQTPQWHEMRKSMIGASDAPVIMGVSPWKTQHQLWLEKLGLYKQESGWHMQRGLELEEGARNLFREITGIRILPDVF